MFNTSMTPPTVDQATVDYYVAKGRRERSQAAIAFFRSLFKVAAPKAAPKSRHTATA